MIGQGAVRIVHHALRRLEAEPAVADVTAHHQRVAGPGAGPEHRASLLHPAKNRRAEGEGSGGRDRIAAKEGHAERASVLLETRPEGGAVSLGPARWPRGHQEVAERRRRLGRQVGKTRAQEPASNDVRRLICGKMDALDHGVLGDYQVKPGSPRDHGRVVGEVQGPFIATGQGPQGRDPGELVPTRGVNGVGHRLRCDRGRR